MTASMTTAWLVFLSVFSAVMAANGAEESVPSKPTVVLVVGAPGQDEFQTNFQRQVELWTQVCDKARATAVRIGLDIGATNADLDFLKKTLADEANEGTEAICLC